MSPLLGAAVGLNIAVYFALLNIRRGIDLLTVQAKRLADAAEREANR